MQLIPLAISVAKQASTTPSNIQANPRVLHTSQIPTQQLQLPAQYAMYILVRAGTYGAVQIFIARDGLRDVCCGNADDGEEEGWPGTREMVSRSTSPTTKN